MAMRSCAVVDVYIFFNTMNESENHRARVLRLTERVACAG